MSEAKKGRKKWTEKIRFTGNRYICHGCKTEHDPDNMAAFCAACFASKVTVELERLRKIEAASPSAARESLNMSVLILKDNNFTVAPFYVPPSRRVRIDIEAELPVSLFLVPVDKLELLKQGNFSDALLMGIRPVVNNETVDLPWAINSHFFLVISNPSNNKKDIAVFYRVYNA